MNFDVSLVQIVVVTAVINASIHSILILFKKENRKANYFLFLLLISLSCTFTPYFVNGQYFTDFLWLSWLPFSLAYWIGPSLYFYIKSLTNPSFKFSKNHLIHFVPIVLNYIHSIYHAIPEFHPLYVVHVIAEVLEFGSVISVFIYSFLSLKILDGHDQAILSQLSSIENVHLKWLRSFIKILIALFIVVVLYHLILLGIFNKRYENEMGIPLKGVLILYSIAMYWLSIGGYKQTQILNKPIDLSFLLKSDQAEEFIKKIENKKIYLNADLSLKSLSEAVGIPESEISAIINRELGKNFYQFINEFRVEEAKKRLMDPKYKHLKIVGIAYDSGFNSKATFNRLFKQIVGKSPKEYIREAKRVK